MATNLGLDDSLIIEAQKIGGFKTKKEAVTRALEEFIKRKNQLKIIDQFGRIHFDENYNYKIHRNRK